MDVESLYTNIPHKDGVTACRIHLEKQDLPIKPITQLLQFLLTHNYFAFGEDLYLQRMGTSMGSRCAPQYANLFMAELEEAYLSTCTTKPMTYLRYIDDILVIWTAGEEALFKFHDDFNNFHPTINLTLSHSHSEIHFLDTTIRIKDHRIHTSIYRKPTDRTAYLRYDSFHPKHTKQSIIYSQAIRYNRICSEKADRDQHLLSLRTEFHQLGYRPNMTEKQVSIAAAINRDTLLTYKEAHNETRVPLVVTYNPQLEILRKIARELQPVLHKDNRLKEIFPVPPLLSFRQPPNLQQIIVRSALKAPTENGTSPCLQSRCKTCIHIQTTDNVPVPQSQEIHRIKGTFTCRSSNVVYLIMCVQCPTTGLYVGETGQRLSQRMNSHRFSINNSRTDLPVAAHFSKEDHTVEDLRVVILMGHFKTQRERKEWEYKLMQKFKTLQSGLNIHASFMSAYV